MSPVNMLLNQVTCECAECSDTVNITPYTTGSEYDADHTCFECGKVVCESCHGDFPSLNYGEDDIQQVCESCHEEALRVIAESNATDDRTPSGVPDHHIVGHAPEY